MYQRIAVAVDGSSATDQALEEVIKISREQHSTVLLIHVVEESLVFRGGPGFDYGAILKMYREEGEKILDNARQKILAQQPNLQVEQELIELNPFQGRIAEVLVEEATNWKTDLLVLGTHGRRGFNRFFLGSVAENTIRIATFPVLLVRGQEQAS